MNSMVIRTMRYWLLTSCAIASVGQAADLPVSARAGLLSWYDASDTNSAIMAGNRLLAWKDLSGQGHDFTQPANGTAKLIRTKGVCSVGGGGMKCPGVNKSLPAMTVYAVVKTPPGNTPLISFGKNELVAVGWTVGAQPTIFSQGEKGCDTVAATREVEDGEWHLLTFVRDGKERRIYVDGVLAGTGSVKQDTPCNISDMSLFECEMCWSAKMEIAELMLFDQAQNAEQVAKITPYLQEKWEEALSLGNQDLVAFVGNSISTGMYCGNGNTWSAVAGQKLGLNQWVNFSKGGISTPQITALAAERIDPIRKSTRGRGILVFWEVTNDIACNKISGVQALVNICDFCAARKKAGWDKIVVLTVLPRAAGPNFEKVRLEFNDLLKKDYAKYGIDAIVDLGADPAISAPGAENNPTNYCDQVHLTPVGKSRVADLVVPVLKALGVRRDAATSRDGILTNAATKLNR